MATARARHGSYLFQRPGSSNWYVRLRSPDKTVVRSLGTADKLKAESIALSGFPLDDGSVVSIATHKAALLAARPVIESTWQHKMEPGREHVAPDGGKIVATDKELIHIGHNGSVTLIEPNGAAALQYVSRDKSSVLAVAEAFIAADFGAGRGERPKAPARNSDDQIIETYLEHRRIDGYNASEARTVWALFKSLTDNKPLKDADRDDGRLLVKHFMDKGLKSATIEKKIAWLNAAVNLAIKENKLKFNPFGGIIPRLDDAERRLPLDGADMKVIRSNLKRLDNSDQLLLRMLAATGMRLAEAYGIDSEQTENRCRFVTVGTKNEQSQRRVPLPATVLEYLPKKITGPLFVSTYKDPVDAASKRLNRFLRDCGIADPRKVLHSLRHRAQDRLRAAGCPQRPRRYSLRQRQGHCPDPGQPRHPQQSFPL